MELEGFVGLEGESVEGTDVVALDAHGGGILVEVPARDFHARGGVLGGLKMNFAGGVGGDDVAGSNEVVNNPKVIGFFRGELHGAAFVQHQMLMNKLHSSTITVYNLEMEDIFTNTNKHVAFLEMNTNNKNVDLFVFGFWFSWYGIGMPQDCGGRLIKHITQNIWMKPQGHTI